MKKAVFVFILVLLIIPIYAQDYYRSNILGMKLNRVDGLLTEGYVILVEDLDDKEIRILYENGNVLSKTEVERIGVKTTETVFESGSKKVTVREKGLPVSEETEIYAEDGMGRTVELFRYEYDGSLLSGVIFSVDSEEVYRDRYWYSSEGRLLDVERSFPEREGIISSYVFLKGRLNDYWYKDDEQTGLMVFNSEGISRSTITGAGGYTETRFYGKLEGGGSYREIRSSENGDILRIEYDENGKLTSSLQYDEDGRIVEEVKNIYNEELLSSTRIRNSKGNERILFEYDREDRLIREVYYRNGNVIEETEYSDSENFSRLLYRDGKAEIRIVYRDGEKYRTEQIEGQNSEY